MQVKALETANEELAVAKENSEKELNVAFDTKMEELRKQIRETEGR